MSQSVVFFSCKHWCTSCVPHFTLSFPRTSSYGLDCTLVRPSVNNAKTFGTPSRCPPVLENSFVSAATKARSMNVASPSLSGISSIRFSRAASSDATALLKVFRTVASLWKVITPTWVLSSDAPTSLIMLFRESFNILKFSNPMLAVASATRARSNPVVLHIAGYSDEMKHTHQVIQFRCILIRGKCNFSKYGHIHFCMPKRKIYSKKKLLREPKIDWTVIQCLAKLSTPKKQRWICINVSFEQTTQTRNNLRRPLYFRKTTFSIKLTGHVQSFCDFENGQWGRHEVCPGVATHLQEDLASLVKNTIG